MSRGDRIITALLSPWAVLPEYYQQMLGIYERWSGGGTLTPELRAEIEAAIGKPLKNQPERYVVTPEGVAVIPMHG